MGIDFEKYYFTKRFVRTHILAGKARTWRKCLKCGKTIKGGTPVVGVHIPAYEPNFYHPHCAKEIAEALALAANSFPKIVNPKRTNANT